MPRTRAALDAVTAALAEFEVIDHGSLAQVVRPDGDHLCVVGFDPLCVELELSVVLLVDGDDDDALAAWAAAADASLRSHQVGAWLAEGWVVAPEGEVLEGRAVDDPSRSVWSYELAVTARASSATHVRELLDRALSRDREFVLWELGGPMTALTPA